MRATTEAEENMTLAHRLELMERRSMAPNILKKGLEEGAGEQRLREIISLPPGDAIKSFHLIKSPTGAKTLLVIVECTHVAAKQRVFQRKKDLRKGNIVMDYFLTKQQLETHAAQASKVRKNSRKNGSLAGELEYALEGRRPR